MSMSIVSRWTIGARASKKARLAAPVAAPMLSARASRDHGQAGGGQGIDPLASDLQSGLGGEGAFDPGRKQLAVDRQGRSRWHPRLVRCCHDQRAGTTHFVMEQADGVLLAVVRAERVRADQLSESVGLVGRRALAPLVRWSAAHFR
jgi:hypothetical protein